MKDLSHIHELDLAWFPDPYNKEVGGAKSGEFLSDKNGHKLLINFTKNSPAQKLSEEKLLIASYAWDVCFSTFVFKKPFFKLIFFVLKGKLGLHSNQTL